MEVTCKHCGLLIERNVSGTGWIHSLLSVYCPGSGNRLTAEPKQVT